MYVIFLEVFERFPSLLAAAPLESWCQIRRFPHYKAIKEMTTRHKNQIKCNAMTIVGWGWGWGCPSNKTMFMLIWWYFSCFPEHKAHIKLLWSKINDKENWQNQQLSQLLSGYPHAFPTVLPTIFPALSIVKLFPNCFSSVLCIYT